MNKNVFITGGSRGIGAAAVLAFAQAGYNVAFTYHAHPEAAEAVCCQAQQVAPDGRFLALQADAADAAQVRAAVAEAARVLGNLQVLVCNAGIAQVKLFTDTTDEDWRRMMAVDLDGAFYACRAVLPGMIHQKYGRILLVSLPTFILQNMFQSFFVTAEKPHLGFAFTVGAGCTNMVLDVVLVGVLRWGVEGAAVATFLSQIVGGLLPVFYFLDRNNTSRLHLSRTKFYGCVLRNACINGSSELMTNLSMSLVNILYNYQLLRFAGEDGVAAYGVIMYAAFLFVAVFVGYAVGSAPIVSYHYGARNHREVHNLYSMSFRLIGVVAVVMTIGSMFLIPHVARIFVGYDAGLLTLTTHAFRLYALSFLIMGFNVYASSFFTALGDGVTSALISFLRTLLFQVAAVFALPALMGMDGIWLAVTAAELAALGVSVYMFVTKDRKFHYRHV